MRLLQPKVRAFENWRRTLEQFSGLQHDRPTEITAPQLYQWQSNLHSGGKTHRFLELVCKISFPQQENFRLASPAWYVS
jgi:hypothetical protein